MSLWNGVIASPVEIMSSFLDTSTPGSDLESMYKIRERTARLLIRSTGTFTSLYNGKC